MNEYKVLKVLAFDPDAFEYIARQANLPDAEVRETLMELQAAGFAELSYGRGWSITDAGAERLAEMRDELQRLQDERPSPKIEILVVRDPDMENDIRIFIDGTEAAWDDKRVFTYDVDAGAGHEAGDWLENYRDMKERDDISEAFRAKVLAALADPPGRKYIEDWDWEESIDDLAARLDAERSDDEDWDWEESIDDLAARLDAERSDDE